MRVIRPPLGTQGRTPFGVHRHRLRFTPPRGPTAAADVLKSLSGPLVPSLPVGRTHIGVLLEWPYPEWPYTGLLPVVVVASAPQTDSGAVPAQVFRAFSPMNETEASFRRCTASFRHSMESVP
jgi:hypothetical protein